MNGKKVVVGMSGGVDSSVAALLLKERGYDVVGLFMNNWKEEDGSGCCTAVDDWQDALGAAGKIGIPCYSVDLSEQYVERVFSYFLAEYSAGRTPNPDVLCNREIKFSAFKDRAKLLGADLVATGHYCGVGEKDGQPVLLRARDKKKDQTYFLNQVTTEQLGGVLFPLADLEKSEVRAIAERAGLVNAKKKDSTGICFIGERKFREFLSQYLPARPGRIVSTEGRDLGEHMGLMYYTLGQRKGLGIGGVSGEEQARWFVVEKRLETNELVVSCGEGEELFSRSLTGEKFNIIGPHDFGFEFDCSAKTRYREPDRPAHARLSPDGDLFLEFDRPERAVTPGQYAVLYIGERCIGGCVITSRA